MSSQFPPHIRQREIDGVFLAKERGRQKEGFEKLFILVKLRTWFLLLDAACDLIK